MKLRLLVAAIGLSFLTVQANAETAAAGAKPAVTGQQAAPAVTAAASSALSSQKDKVSYSIGMDLGENFKAQTIDINPDVFLQGFKDGLAGNKALLSKAQRDEILQAFQKEFRAKKEAELKALSEKNKQASLNFLNTNKAKPGVITLPSGLQYKIVKVGSGTKPTDNDVVTVNYVGRLPDGKEFDSSIKHGKPVTFTVSNVIPGWREALKLMSPGASLELVVPPELAYGDAGIPGSTIGPNQVLVFQIDLLSVKAPEKSANPDVKLDKAPVKK